MDPTNNLLSSTARPTFSVKPCTGPYMDKSVATIEQAQNTRRSFANSVGKVGDLQVLNSIGAGAIGEGLRTLTHASNAVRTGCGSLPTIIGSSIDQGANWVLSNIGIAPAVIETLKQFHPEVANSAWGSAQQIYQRIQQGHFKTTDIPSYLQEFQNLERLARGIYTPGDDRINSLSPRCEASPYAMDLIARAPKYKFLFLVQFIPAEGYEALDSVLRGMAFVVKKSSRPHIKYVTEDVNYYNYRTKVITKTEYLDMSMTFHDDVLNNTTRVYSAYLKAMTPSANLKPSMMPSIDMLESAGMNFSGQVLQSGQDSIEQSIPSNVYSASIGPLVSDNKQIIFKNIVLYHVFDSGNSATVYTFVNPRITELTPDDVDMSLSDGNELTITFSYDYVSVETDVKMSDLDSKLRDAQSDALYPLRYNGETSSTQGPNPNGLNPYGIPVQPVNSCNTMGTVNTSSNNPAGPFNGGFGAGF